jgi:neutral ceramidase
MKTFRFHALRQIDKLGKSLFGLGRRSLLVFNERTATPLSDSTSVKWILSTARAFGKAVPPLRSGTAVQMFLAGRSLRRILFCVLVISFGFALPTVAEDTWKAGLAKENITPENGLWLAGYATRTKPADGKLMELWAKALALEDAAGHKAIIVTTDTLGIPQSIYLHTLASVKEKFGLDPQQVILSASHTHCGPVLRNALYDAYPLDEQQRELIEKYSQVFEAKLVQAIGDALGDLSPAELSARAGETNFAVNRRNNTEGKVPKLLQEGALKGPIDHAVPVLTVTGADGKLRAVLFGYACHNTVMSFNKWSGDYAGFAQLALEKSHPGAQAMFFMGCGGDQNPLPRGKLEIAERYGSMLAAAVEEAMREKGRDLSPQLATSIEMVKLDLGPEPTKAELETMKNGTNASAKRWSTRILADLEAGKQPIRSYPFPLQAWSLGRTHLLLTMGGESVVDYALKFKKEFGPQTWVAGYCNDVMTYIPSLRVLKEGGYEGGKAFIPYGMPALRWADDVEDRITASAERLVRKVKP